MFYNIVNWTLNKRRFIRFIVDASIIIVVILAGVSFIQRGFEKGFINLYHSNWFIPILIFLTILIFVYIITSLPARVETIATPEIRFDKELNNLNSWWSKDNISNVKKRIKDVFNKNGYRIVENGNGPEGCISIFAHKGILSNFGPFIIHVGILTIILGMMGAYVSGSRDVFLMDKGETVNIKWANFSLMLDDPGLEEKKWEGYSTLITLIEEGEETLANTIKQGRPLKHKGAWIFQDRTGESWHKVESARIRVKGEGGVIGVYSVDFNGELRIPGSDYKVKFTRFIPDFAVTMKDKEVFSRSKEHKNPAVLLEEYRGGIPEGSRWIFKSHNAIHTFKGSEYQFELIDYVPSVDTTIEVIEAPNLIISWVGNGIVFLGILLSIFVPFKRVWVRIADKGEEAHVYLGGMIDKYKARFEKEFDGLSEAMGAKELGFTLADGGKKLNVEH